MRKLCVAAAVFSLSCGAITPARKLGETCSRDYPHTEYNGDCESGLFCSGTCHNRCSSSIRCPTGCTCDLGAFSNYGPCTGADGC
jgi:hypothetical protein